MLTRDDAGEEEAKSNDDLLFEIGILSRPKSENMRPKMRSESSHRTLIVEIEFGECSVECNEGGEMGGSFRREEAEESEEFAKDSLSVGDERGRV